MTKKLDNLSSDILALLKKHEPKRLRHNEICDSLFNSSYQFRYKDKKVFGVAVSQKLKLLKAKELIIHEDIWYGTVKSEPHKEKPSSERPSRLNFWEYRKWKRQYEDKRLDKNIRELQCERDIYHEKFEIYKKMPREKRNDPLPVDVEAQLRKKWRKFHDLE